MYLEAGIGGGEIAAEDLEIVIADVLLWTPTCCMWTWASAPSVITVIAAPVASPAPVIVLLSTSTS